MNMHTNAEYAVTTGRRRIPDIVAEYDQKVQAAEAAVQAFEDAGRDLERACSVAGAYGSSVNTGSVSHAHVLECLRKSAWRHLWDAYDIALVASARDKRLYEQLLVNPPEFTIQNIRDQIGDLIRDPRQSMLRALAETFSSLDPFYRSHERVKVGVKGLPKRIIISGLGSWRSWGEDRVRDVLNALAAYQGKPLATHREVQMLLNDGDALREAGEMESDVRGGDPVPRVGRGVWLKRYGNGNGHLFFDQQTLLDVNRALAEFYGDVLVDTPDERPAKRQTGTEVSKDLQYYPTPAAVVSSMLSGVPVSGKRVLEPSCGCGRILDAVRAMGGDAFGIEVDAGRAEEARSKGHKVHTANFLDTVPRAEFDLVVMNPPFYGKHYEKHVRHALRYLKPGGRLLSVLPATARYDHGLLDDLRPSWSDLPVGSFSASGTNVNTVVADITKRQ